MFARKAPSILVKTGSPEVRILAFILERARPRRSRFSLTIRNDVQVTRGKGRTPKVRCKPTEYDVGDSLLVQNPTHLKRVELSHEAEARPRDAVSLALAIRLATRTISCARSATDILKRSRIWLTSTPRQSSFGFCHSSTTEVYAPGVSPASGRRRRLRWRWQIFAGSRLEYRKIQEPDPSCERRDSRSPNTQMSRSLFSSAVKKAAPIHSTRRPVGS